MHRPANHLVTRDARRDAAQATAGRCVCKERQRMGLAGAVHGADEGTLLTCSESFDDGVLALPEEL